MDPFGPGTETSRRRSLPETKKHRQTDATVANRTERAWLLVGWVDPECSPGQDRTEQNRTRGRVWSLSFGWLDSLPSRVNSWIDGGRGGGRRLAQSSNEWKEGGRRLGRGSGWICLSSSSSSPSSGRKCTNFVQEKKIFLWEVMMFVLDASADLLSWLRFLTKLTFFFSRLRGCIISNILWGVSVIPVSPTALPPFLSLPPHPSPLRSKLP